MRFLFVLFFFISFSTLSQVTVNVGEITGEKLFKKSKPLILKDGSVIIDGEKSSYQFNTKGELVEKFENSILSADEDGFNEESHGYNAKFDVRYSLNAGYFFYVSNYSKKGKAMTFIQLPALNDLQTTGKSGKKKSESLFYKQAVQSEYVYFKDAYHVVVFNTFCSYLGESHGKVKHDKSKFYTFMRIMYLDLYKRTITTEYKMIDKIREKRKELDEVNIKIAGGNDESVRVVFVKRKLMPTNESRKMTKLGVCDVFDFYYRENEWDSLTSISVTGASGKMYYMNISVSMQGILNTYSQLNMKVRGYSYHSKFYQIKENGDVDSMRFSFPPDVVNFLVPQVPDMEIYENEGGECFAVIQGSYTELGLKDQHEAYLLLTREGQMETRDSFHGSWDFWDEELDRTVNLAIELDENNQELQDLANTEFFDYKKNELVYYSVLRKLSEHEFTRVSSKIILSNDQIQIKNMIIEIIQFGI